MQRNPRLRARVCGLPASQRSGGVFTRVLHSWPSREFQLGQSSVPLGPTFSPKGRVHGALCHGWTIRGEAMPMPSHTALQPAQPLPQPRVGAPLLWPARRLPRATQAACGWEEWTGGQQPSLPQISSPPPARVGLLNKKIASIWWERFRPLLPDLCLGVPHPLPSPSFSSHLAHPRHRRLPLPRPGPHTTGSCFRTVCMGTPGAGDVPAAHGRCSAQRGWCSKGDEVKVGEPVKAGGRAGYKKVGEAALEPSSQLCLF